MSRCASIAPKKLRCADEIGERHGEMEYRGGQVLQRWRGSGGNVRLSHLLMSFNTVETRYLAVAKRSRSASYNSLSGQLHTFAECLLCEITYVLTQNSKEAAAGLQTVAARPRASSLKQRTHAICLYTVSTDACLHRVFPRGAFQG